MNDMKAGPIAGIVGLIAMVGVTVFMLWPRSDAEHRQAQASETAATKDELHPAKQLDKKFLKKLLLGEPLEDVTKLLGKPDRIDQPASGRECWHYVAGHDPQTGKLAPALVWLEAGKVSSVEFER